MHLQKMDFCYLSACDVCLSLYICSALCARLSVPIVMHQIVSNLQWMFRSRATTFFRWWVSGGCQSTSTRWITTSSTDHRDRYPAGLPLCFSHGILIALLHALPDSPSPTSGFHTDCSAREPSATDLYRKQPSAPSSIPWSLPRGLRTSDLFSQFFLFPIFFQIARSDLLWTASSTASWTLTLRQVVG